jgi:class 3 adenylate cyclase/streptogramin lyase
MAKRGSSALLTVLFTDIVGSTEAASEMGDRRWRELLTRHHRIVRALLKRHGGREVDTAGDGFLATFSQPASAVRCAREITEEVQALGVDIRAGVHVGEVEVMGSQVGGVAVHAGARIAAVAGPGELVVSRTLQELVPGARFGFEDRGAHRLKGVPGEHHLYRVTTVDGRPQPPPLGPDEAGRRREAIEPPPLHRRRGVVLAAAVAVALGAAAVEVVVAGRETPRVRPSGFPAGTVVRIDPASDRIVESIPGVAPAPLRAGEGFVYEPSLVAEGGALWVLARSSLVHIDARTREVSEVQTSGTPIRMALGHGAVWVTGGRDILMRVDVADLEETDTISLGPQIAFGRPLAVTIDSVWAGSQHELIRIDPVAAKVTDRIPLDLAVDRIAATPREVWIADRLEKTLGRFSPERLRIVETIPLQISPDDLAVGDADDIWIVNRDAGTVTPLREGRAGNPIQVGSEPVDIAVGDDAVWVADLENGTVTRIDRSFDRVEKVIEVGDLVQAVAVDPSTGDVWALVP